MPDVIIPGPEGRLEGKYTPGKEEFAPIALILHAHPLGGGNMENLSSVMMYDIFRRRGFATLRFNFRGVGRSQGTYDQGLGVNCPMPRRRSTGSKPITAMRRFPGLLAIPLVRGSACNC